MVLSRFVRGTDLKTAFERISGRRCTQEVVPIGESILYKSAKTSTDWKRVVGENWRDGIWLGHVRGSSDYLIGTPEGGGAHHQGLSTINGFGASQSMGNS